jgi:hypothetical protein
VLIYFFYAKKRPIPDKLRRKQRQNHFKNQEIPKNRINTYITAPKFQIYAYSGAKIQDLRKKESQK